VQVFRGREEILRKVQCYLSKPMTEPLVLYGLSGSGKTSVLARSASLVRQWLPDTSPAIVIRFLGKLYS
jgi:ABC-type phosphate/phosphonate transport system ATPase subunit